MASSLARLVRPSATLVVPTLNEVTAVGRLAVLFAQVQATDVFDRAVIMDGGSEDGTVAQARVAGLDVLVASEMTPGGPVLGKGDSLWRAADIPGDVLVFRDADVEGVSADDLVSLIRAVATEGVALAKGHFRRLQYADGPARPTSGRITEFVARPLLGILAPELAHVTEPLSGQFAIRRDVLRQLPVVTRYGADIGLVLAVAHHLGPGAITSVDLGALTHRAKQDASLVPMAHDVAATILAMTASTWPAAVGTDQASATDDHSGVATRLPRNGAQGWMVVRPPRNRMTVGTAESKARQPSSRATSSRRVVDSNETTSGEATSGRTSQ